MAPRLDMREKVGTLVQGALEAIGITSARRRRCPPRRPLLVERGDAAASRGLQVPPPPVSWMSLKPPGYPDTPIRYAFRIPDNITQTFEL